MELTLSLTKSSTSSGKSEKSKALAEARPTSSSAATTKVARTIVAVGFWALDDCCVLLAKGCARMCCST